MSFVKMWYTYESHLFLWNFLLRPLGLLVWSIIPGVSAVTALFFPVVTIHRIGPKPVMAGCLLSITLYCGVLFHPISYTVVLAAVIMGVQCALFWTSLGAYVMRVRRFKGELRGEFTRFMLHGKLRAFRNSSCILILINVLWLR